MELRNSGPFPAGWIVRLGIDGGERVAVALRGTWAIAEDGKLSVLQEQPPLLAIDEFFGEPGLSSIRYEADLGPMKRATDVALVARAMPLHDTVTEHVVAFRAGPVSQNVLVLGERYRQLGAAGYGASTPRPLQPVLMTWELASGGSDMTPDDEQHQVVDSRNPLGRSVVARNTKLVLEGAPLPQMVRMDRSEDEPVGLGFIGPHWEPRKRYAGTYDDAWRSSRCPLLPTDFDDRFFNSAAPGLTAPDHFLGGESVEVYGCTSSGSLYFELPRLQPEVEASFDGSKEPVPMAINTVTVDTDAMQLRVCWRGEIGVHRRLPGLRQIDVRSPDWLA